MVSIVEGGERGGGGEGLKDNAVNIGFDIDILHIKTINEYVIRDY